MWSMRERLPLLIGLTLLSIAILIGSLAIGSGIKHRNQSDVVTVTGSAKQRITSDFAIWDLSVTSHQSSAATAAKQLTGWSQKTIAFLKAQGVEPSELTVQPISTNTVTDTSNFVTGYQLTRNFEIRSARVQAVADVAEASSQLIAGGIPLSAQPLQYVYTKLAALRPSLLASAVRDAQNRGKVLVGTTGGSLGKLRGVDVGVFQVTSPNSTEVSDYGVYDTSTRQKEVTAVVNVTFALH
jgi:uncharacterized protein